MSLFDRLPVAQKQAHQCKAKLKVYDGRKMNDFPVIGHLVIRTGLWDRQGANIASRFKGLYGVELFLL